MHTISRAERVRAATFLTVGLLLIGGLCGLLIGLPLLKNTRQYFVRFKAESISGIAKGSDVRYQGVKKGRVKSYTIDYDIVQLELEVDSDLHVTKSTLARISSDGLLPPYFVELRGSKRDSPELPEGSIIETDPSTTSTLVQKGMAIADHFDAVLANLERWTGEANEAKLVKMLDEATSAITTANQTVIALRPETERLVKAYADAGEELARAIAENREALRELLGEARKAVAEVNRFLTDGKLDAVTAEAVKTLDGVRTDFNRATATFSRVLEESKLGERLEQAVASVERAEQSLGKLSGVVQAEIVDVSREGLVPALMSFRAAMASLEELSRTLRNDPALILLSKPRSEIDVPRPGYR